MKLTVNDAYVVLKARMEDVNIQQAIHYKEFWQDVIELATQAKDVATLDTQS